jgi:hypothetical protein
MKFKGLFFLILLITGAVLAFIRIFRNKRSGNQLQRTLKQLQSNPAYSEQLASRLDCFIERHNPVDQLMITALIKQLRKHPILGKYEIHEIITIKTDEYLFITTCTDEDYSLKASGKMGTVKEVFQTNFILRKNKAQEREEIYSHQYESREEERFLKTFAKDVFSLLDTMSIQQHS